MSSIWTNPIEYGNAWLSLLMSPWFYFACLFPLLHIVWIGWMERKDFGAYLEPPMPLILRTWMLGFVSGMVISFFLSRWVFPLSAVEVTVIWGCTLCFALFDIRFTCLAYTAGLLALISLFARKLEMLSSFIPTPWDKLWLSLQHVSVSSWLWLVAILHLLEWALIRLDGAYGSQPIQIQHRSGRTVNGFLLKKGWPIPLVILTFSGWIPIPVFLSFATVNLSKPLKQQKRLSSTLTLLYGGALCGCLLLATLVGGEVWLWIAAILSIVGHEGIFQWGRWKEKQKEPLFVTDERGLKVLAVLPDSPATAMGVKTGDIVQRLNGVRIRTLEDLEKVTEQAAFCKLEVLDERLDRHIMQKALYENDPRNLGIVAAMPFGLNGQESVQEISSIR